MLPRNLVVWLVLIATQSAVAEERSLVVARRTTDGAIVTAPQAPERSVVVASREVPVDKAARAADKQILVQVEMLEVSRTKLRKMGTDLPNAPGKTSNAKTMKAYLDWLEENRVAKEISRPNIVVNNGRPASFFVGGEVPIPTRDDANTSVEFRKFGTEVDLLATAADNEQVRMELRIKVSQLDDSHAIKINGTRVPGFTVRQCDTALSVACGETAIIECPGEIRRTETVKTSDGQMKDQDNEIILLVAVTPEFVDPISSPESAPSNSSRK